MTFIKFLSSRVKDCNSLLCVGLDPHPDDLPEQSAQVALEFCLRLIEETVDLAAAYKPNSAFFEALGAEGVAVLRDVIAAVPDGIPVILDAKRGDIASTALAYSHAAFQELGANALTINPYLGKEAILPFLQDPERGVFLLCKTSNPGAADFQELIVSGSRLSAYRDHTLYEVVALQAQTWNKNNNLGLVVGATHPQALARVRDLAPDMWILAPGVGAQGGDLSAALRVGLRPDGMGMLIPVSRGISRAENPRKAAQTLRDEINRHRELTKAHSSTITGHTLSDIADDLLESGCVKFGEFTLKSGKQSPIYIDLRRLTGYPALLKRVAAAYLPILRDLSFDRIAALPYAALPIGTAISLLGDWSMVYPRKQVKDYGTRAAVEGVYSPGERVVLVDDLVTTAGSKFEAIDQLNAVGLQVSDVVVLIDRQSGAGDELKGRGYRLHAAFTLTELLDYWESVDRVPDEQISAVREFLELT